MNSTFFVPFIVAAIVGAGLALSIVATTLWLKRRREDGLPSKDAEIHPEAIVTRGGMTNRTYALFLHLAPFLDFALPFAGTVTALVLWLRKKEDPFVDLNGRNVFNFLVSLFLISLFLLFGFGRLGGEAALPVLSGGLAVFASVVRIFGAVRASEGHAWTYPIALPLFRAPLSAR